MGLLTKERDLIENNYFQVWNIVELLHETQLLEEDNFFERNIFKTWHEVGLYLGHHSFDRKLQLFKKDDYYNVIPYEFYPPYQPIRNLIQRLKYEWLIGDEKSIKTIEEEVNHYYWLKKDIYNFKPIMDLDIIERPCVTPSLETPPPEETIQKLFDLKEEVEQLKVDLAQSQKRIAELEASHNTTTELSPNQEIPNTRMRNNVLKIIAVLADMADLPNEPFTAFNMMDAHARSKRKEMPSKDTTATWLNDAKKF